MYCKITVYDKFHIIVLKSITVYKTIMVAHKIFVLTNVSIGSSGPLKKLRCLHFVCVCLDKLGDSANAYLFEIEVQVFVVAVCSWQ